MSGCALTSPADDERNYPTERPARWADYPATYLGIFLGETGWPHLTEADKAELRRVVDGFLYSGQEANQ